MNYKTAIKIADRDLAIDKPTYFIADIAANHDGDVERAKALIWHAKEAGADCAKFQHFLAKDIVSDRGFRDLGNQKSHQAGWKKSIFEIYDDYSCPRDWSETLYETCQEADIHFMTAPYDVEAIDTLDQWIPAFKVGSGDITWHASLRRMASKGKPVLLATGASDMAEVERAVETILTDNSELVLMHCNTNYTGSLENFGYVNLRVLQAFALHWPGMILGLSDHTPGHAAVLGAVALGARVVEKHFTDDINRDGPDHAFSLTPVTWREMVDRTRELEMALGDGVKRVEDNERETVQLQRRAIRSTSDLAAGTVIAPDMLEVLRPCPADGLPPYKLDEVVGLTLKRDLQSGEHLTWTDLASRS